MFRKIVPGAALTLAVGIFAVGCSDDDDSSSGTKFFVRVDNFSTNQVLDNNAASDKWGFSPNNKSVQDFEVYWNHTTGKAMGVLETRDDDTNRRQLWLSYFDGSKWNALQEVIGTNEDRNQGVNGFKFMWIGSASNSRWSGHGILLYTRDDLEPLNNTASPDEDRNRRLYGAIVGTNGTLLGDAEQLDFDHQLDGTSGDNDVGVFGFASDSLVCSHRFDSGNDNVDSGEQTSLVEILFSKNPTVDTGTNVGDRFFHLTVDLTGTDPAVDGLPTQTGATTGQLSLDSAVGSITNGDDNFDDDFWFTVHNNAVIWNSYVDNTGDGDNAVTVTLFDALGVDATLNLGNSNTANFDYVAQPDPDAVFGPDHGLDAGYVVYEESGFTDGTNGSRAGDSDAMVAMVHDLGGSFTIERQEIDAYTDTIDTTDTDGDGVNRIGSEGSVNDGEVVMTRGGDIFVLLRQASDNLNDPDDSTNTIVPGDADENDILFMVAIQTIQNGVARTLANSVSSTVTVPAPHQSVVNATTPVDQDNITDFDFQIELVQGRARAQSGENCDRGCAIQSDHTTVHFAFTQWADVTASDDDNLELYVNGGFITRDTTGSAAPTLTLTGASASLLIDAKDGDYNDGDYYDRGLIDRGSLGDCVIFYNSQDNSDGQRLQDFVDSGDFDANRLYVRDLENDTAGTEWLVSTDARFTVNLDDSFQLGGFEEGVTTPRNENFANQPNHSGTRFDLFWSEDVDRNGNSYRLATRSLSKTNLNSTASNAPNFEDCFTPALGTASVGVNPEYIDLSTDGAFEGVEAVLVNGSTVGVYFDEDDHAYYTESSKGSGGYTQGPQLIDNFNARNMWWFDVVPAPGCNDLSRSMVVYEKDEPTGGDDRRLYIRVKN